MFINTALKRTIEEIRSERKVISNEKLRVESALRELKDKYHITDNNVRNRSGLSSLKIPPEVWDIRDKYVKQIKEFNAKLEPLKKEFLEAHIQEDTEQNIALMSVFGEIFSYIQRQEIMLEIKRRRNGEQPMPLGLDFKELERYKEGHHKYRKLAKEQIDKMIEFRIMLTGLIEQGCNQFGNSEFLKFISPLNKLIIPVDELRKIKTKNLL